MNKKYKNATILLKKTLKNSIENIKIKANK